MSEHSSVEKNIDLLRLFFKDLVEDQAIYEKSNSRVLEFSLAFDHSRLEAFPSCFRSTLNSMEA